MPEKLERCVRDVKAQGKSEDSAWGICVDSTGEKPHQDTKKEVAEAIGMAESHNPLDIPFGYEVSEASIKVDNSHSGLDKLNKMSEVVLKQILETQIGECSCKNKTRPHVRK